MASLENTQTGKCVTLMVQHHFGRHPAAYNTILHNPDASRMHAVIMWDGDQWSIKDTSTNGTYINKVKLTPGVLTKLSKGDKIQFGNPQSGMWELRDDSPPKSLLLPTTDDSPVIELTDIAALPSEDSPEVTLYLSTEGYWICESQSGSKTLKSGDLVGTNEKTWRFFDAKPSTKTFSIDLGQASQSPTIEFLFKVSQNEEHVTLILKAEARVIDLGERSHHYLLLVLARQRLSDRATGLDVSEQGWISKDLLSKMLGLSEQHINIQIYRFRKQIIAALSQNTVLYQSIERRSGELRFAYDTIIIDGGLQTTDMSVGNKDK